MSSYDNHDLFKEMYHNEHARRETINGRVNIPLGLLPILIGAGLICYDKKDEVSFGKWTWIFDFSMGLYFAILIITAYYLFRSYIGYKYHYFPSTKEIDQYTKQLNDYYDNEDDSSKNKKIEDKMRSFLVNFYRNSTHENMIQNERKLQFLWRSGIFLIFSVISGLILGSLFFIGQKDELEKPTKVQIIQNVKTKTDQKGGENKMPEDNQQPPQPDQSSRPEPTPPEARIMHENFERLPQEITPPKEK